MHSISTQQDTFGQRKGSDTEELGAGHGVEEYCIGVTFALGVYAIPGLDGEGLTWGDAFMDPEDML